LALSTLIDLLERSFDKNTENDAIYYSPNSYSYGRIREAINRLAQSFLSLGIKKGDRVAILLPNLVQFPITYFAALKAGAVAVPLNFLLTRSQIQEQLVLVEPAIIVVWQNILSKIEPIPAPINCKVVVLGDHVPEGFTSLTRLIAYAEPIKSTPEIFAEDVAVIVFTAGNSGNPKAVQLTHESIITVCRAFRAAFMIDSSESFMTVMPLFLAISQVAILNTAFIAGSKLILHPTFEVPAIADLIHEQGASILVGNNAMYRTFFDAAIEPEKLSSLKYCISFGDILSQEILDTFEKKYGIHLYESYGLCEATTFVTLNRTDGEQRKGSAGVPLESIHLKIVNTQGEMLPEGEIGEILVHGPSHMKGYLGQPVEDEKVIEDGWLHTRDLGTIDSHGYLYVLERAENVIFKAGFQVFPHEIETLLAEHPQVAEVAVIGVPEAVHGEEVKACIVPKPDAQVDAAEIIEYCRQRLELYKCPKYVQVMKSLPKSPTGRILKYQLKNNLI
jgi:long-chain acyl-CoA synthetase